MAKAKIVKMYINITMYNLQLYIYKYVFQKSIVFSNWRKKPKLFREKLFKSEVKLAK